MKYAVSATGYGPNELYVIEANSDLEALLKVFNDDQNGLKVVDRYGSLWVVSSDPDNDIVIWTDDDTEMTEEKYRESLDEINGDGQPYYTVHNVDTNTLIFGGDGGCEDDDKYFGR